MFAETKMQAPEPPGTTRSDPARSSASLEQLTGAPMPVADFLALAVHVTGELAALHARGVIHHDLRPSTIRFDAATGAVALGRPPGADGKASALSESAL